MALTKQELEEYRNFKRKLDMAQTPQGQIALKLAGVKRKQDEARNTLLRRCGVNVDAQEENPILKFYK